MLSPPSAANVLDCKKEADMNNQQIIPTMNNQGIAQINYEIISTTHKPTPKITILYERLSVEDERSKDGNGGQNGESNSITAQRNLLEQYAERNGFIPFIHISDDGYSGTNWNRPGWQELISKVEADEVATILVKDSSRIGRDHLRVGLFREMLRDREVRLIAINDGLDSAKGEDDFTPFRDIMAEKSYL